MAQAKRKAKSEKTFTYADYCTWPETVRCELIDGVAFDAGQGRPSVGPAPRKARFGQTMTPGPVRQHSLISGNLFRQFGNFFEGKTCEVHAAPFDVRLPKQNERDEEINTVVQPDIVVVCDETKLDDKGCRGAPDLVVEILSPSTASRDHITKKALYEKHGVKEYWPLLNFDNKVEV